MLKAACRLVVVVGGGAVAGMQRIWCWRGAHKGRGCCCISPVNTHAQCFGGQRASCGYAEATRERKEGRWEGGKNKYTQKKHNSKLVWGQPTHTHKHTHMRPSRTRMNPPLSLSFFCRACFFLLLPSLFRSHFRGNIDYIIGLAAVVTLVFNPDMDAFLFFFF